MHDLDLLATFLEVYRRGSFSAAATHLSVSQPSVSERIARLEGERGARLFDRGARGVMPTSAAHGLARQVGDSIDRLRDIASSTEATHAGVVRMGAATDFAAERLVTSLAPLVRNGVQLVLKLGLTDDLLADMRRGDLDVVIATSRRPASGVQYSPLIDEEFVLIGPPSATSRGRTPLDIQALESLPLVAYDEQLSMTRRYWRSEFGHRPPNPIAAIIADLRGMRAAVVAGMGIAVLPQYIADSVISSGGAVILHRPTVPPLNTLYLAVLRETPPNPSLDSVIANLRASAREWDVL